MENVHLSVKKFHKLHSTEYFIEMMTYKFHGLYYMAILWNNFLK